MKNVFKFKKKSFTRVPMVRTIRFVKQTINKHSRILILQQLYSQYCNAYSCTYSVIYLPFTELEPVIDKTACKVCFKQTICDQIQFQVLRKKSPQALLHNSTTVRSGNALTHQASTYSLFLCISIRREEFGQRKKKSKTKKCKDLF